MQEKHCKNWTKPELGFQQGTCTGKWKLTGKYIISIENKRKNYEKIKLKRDLKKRNKKEGEYLGRNFEGWEFYSFFIIGSLKIYIQTHTYIYNKHIYT